MPTAQAFPLLFTYSILDTQVWNRMIPQQSTPLYLHVLHICPGTYVHTQVPPDPALMYPCTVRDKLPREWVKHAIAVFNSTNRPFSGRQTGTCTRPLLDLLYTLIR